MRRIFLVSVALFMVGCVITVNQDGILIAPEQGYLATITPTRTNTPFPTATPQIVRFVTVMARTNFRASASISSVILGVLPSQTRLEVINQVAVGTYSWYQTRHGWVRSDRISGVVSFTSTPSPTPSPTPRIDPTPTQEILTVNPFVIPPEGIPGYTSPDTRFYYRDLTINDNFVILLESSEWMLIATLSSDGWGDYADVFFIEAYK